MRKIKFRAWHVEKKKMFAIDEIDFRVKTVSEFIPNHPTNRTGYDEYAFYELSPLMQFTGLYDKNGKEIWEGDVINGNLGNLMIDFECGSFVAVRIKNPGIKFEIKNFNMKEKEVLGNIYENPELLK
jgi:uncharacterized phage protein (TIGR01671 family)